MKPNFALTLSFDGIGLLHRAGGGWLKVDEVPLSDPDLATALQGLVTRAHDLNPAGITTKLVIPNQQIRYLSFESDSRDIDILEAQVRSTLNGATPYHVSELAYDWSMTGGEVCVAAVAIETLTEAESFAIDHGFSPISFVAVPENGVFQGEPFFGETVHAGEVLTPGDSVERDEDAIVVIGQAALPEPEPEPAPELSPEPEPEPEPEDTAPIAGFQSARRAPPPAVDPAPEASPVQAPDLAPDLAPKTDEPAGAPSVAFSTARSASPASTTEALPQGRFSPGAPEEPAPSDPPVGKAPPALTPEPPRPAPPVAQDLASVAQSQADTCNEPPAAIRPAEKPSGPASQHPGRLPFMSKRQSGGQDPRSDARSGARPAGKDKKDWGADLKSGLGKARSAAAGLASTAARFKPTSAEPSAVDRSALQAHEDERQRMTVFGARNPENATAESNPRFLALAVTAGLLLLLVGIAAWAALFLEGGVSSLFRSSEDVQFANDPAAIEAPAALPSEPDTEIAALPQTEARDVEDLADEPLETLRPDQAPSEELAPDEVRARYAATGIWQMSPAASRAPLEGQFEDVYQTSLDPDVNFSDAVALPNVSRLLPAPQPETPGDPLPPGSDNVARDARGFVLATPEGTVTPDQLITIFAGAPPLLPPTTPERAEPEPEVVEVALVAPDPADEDTGLRPRLRPTDLTDGFERSNNGGRTLNELQNLRPRLRPQSPQEQALAEAGISPEIAETEEGLFEDATEQAVARSLTPRTRPANFANIVQQTRETAAAEPVSIEQRVAAAIPTTASVARAATERNQISLRRLNLIGVYGSDGSRRALVRLPNGRYQKVKVGDRLDGGQVAAIGDGELRYIKRGQSVLLKMPNS